MISDLPFKIGGVPQGTISIDDSDNLTFQPLTGPVQPPPGSSWHLDFHGSSGPLGSSKLSPPMLAGGQEYDRISGNFSDQSNGSGHLHIKGTPGAPKDDASWQAGGTPAGPPKKY